MTQDQFVKAFQISQERKNYDREIRTVFNFVNDCVILSSEARSMICKIIEEDVVKVNANFDHIFAEL